MSITAQLPLLKGYTDHGTRLFMKRSGDIVSSLNTRMKKKGISGRLSLEDGRKALALGLGKSCRYCRKVVTIATMSLDHPMPVARGGDPFTVECIDIDCNHEKSDIPAEDFQKLVEFVRTLAPETQQSIHKALKGGAAYVRLITKNKAMLLQKRDNDARVHETYESVVRNPRGGPDRVGDAR